MLIKRLELLTSNLPAQLDFYSTLLDLPARLEGETLTVSAGKSTLAFTQAPAEWRGAYHFCFNIPENQFMQAREWFASRVPFIKDDKGNDEFHSRTWNASSSYFKDAAGNILEFIARHDQQNAANAPFDSRQILQISEIGLASQDVIAFAKELCETLGVSVYKQEPKADFTPVGDEDGLLILPIENRIWYPNTGAPARMLSVKVDVTVFPKGAEIGKDFNITGVPYEIRRS